MVGGDGFDLSPAWAVTAVNYLFQGYGIAWPGYEFEQIRLVNGRFRHANGSDITPQIERFLASLTGLTPVDEIQVVNLWSDDYPEWYVEIVGQDGRSLLVYSENTGFRGHAPWYVQIDEQFYRQINGDIGFAVHDLVSIDIQGYFTLDAPAFDEEQMGAERRSAIFHQQQDFSGLLPLAINLVYHIDPVSGSLRGSFTLNYAQTDTSTHRITNATQMDLTLPDDQLQSCHLAPEEMAANQLTATTWNFDCPLPANILPFSMGVAVQLNTYTEQLITTVGQINLSVADLGE
jgi:hypothetical protein